MTEKRPILEPGLRFSISTSLDDYDTVEVKKITETHVLLQSDGEMNGWHPRSLIQAAIDESSATQYPHMPL